MATPLTANGRVHIGILVPGAREHSFNIFCNWASDGGDASGYGMLAREGGIRGFQAAMAVFMPVVKALYPNTVDIANPTLESYIAGAYVPLATDGSGGVGTAVSGYTPAQQTSLTLRVNSTAPERMRIQLMETIYPLTGKYVDPTAIGTPLSLFVNQFLPPVGTGGTPYEWACNRGSNFIQGFVSVVFDINKKLRRERGIA